MPLVDLSHPISHGTITYPGLPGPTISDFLTREDSRGHYDEGVEFHIARIDMVANTGTYLDAPSHRWADGPDLAGISLEQIADVPGRIVRAAGPELPADLIDGLELGGMAILFETGWSARWGTDAYFAPGHPHVLAGLAEALVASEVTLVGIDSLNIDDTSGGDRPAHSILLRAGIPIVEHLTGLDAVPESGFWFTATPPMVRGMGTFPVRALARW